MITSTSSPSNGSTWLANATEWLPNVTDFVLGDNGTDRCQSDYVTTVAPTRPDSLAEAAELIFKIGCIVVLIVGTVGNIMTILVMTRTSFRHSVTSVSLTALAVVDQIVLLSAVLRNWLKFQFHFDIRTMSSWSCKLHITVVYAAMDLSSWIVVAITAERTLAITFPTRCATWLSKSRARSLLSFLAVIAIGANCHFIANQELEYADDGSLLCISDDSKEFFYTKVWPVIDLLLYSAIPLLLLTFCNGSIAIQLLRSRRAKRSMHVQQTHVRVINTTSLLLAVSLFFMITTLPICVYLIIQQFWDSEFGSARQFAWAVVNIIAYINNSCNFILYCLSGSRFRKELGKLFEKKSSTLVSQISLSQNVS